MTICLKIYNMEKIKELREEKGLSQMQLAKKIGVDQTTISHYEIGKREPDIAMIKKLCKIFDVSADYLLDLED